MILILDHQSGYLRLELIHSSLRSLTFFGAGNCQSSDDILDRLYKSGEYAASCWPSVLVRHLLHVNNVAPCEGRLGTFPSLTPSPDGGYCGRYSVLRTHYRTTKRQPPDLASHTRRLSGRLSWPTTVVHSPVVASNQSFHGQ